MLKCVKFVICSIPTKIIGIKNLVALFFVLYYYRLMKVTIVCVGKIKEKYFLDAVDEYKKRLSRFCKFSIIEVDEESIEKSTQKKIEIESKSLLSKCFKNLIVLDRKGEECSSEDLAKIIENLANNGVSELSFVIGGSNGVSDEIKKNATKLISFGKPTYPHQLFRVILSEQIYRAFTIINGLPYHK